MTPQQELGLILIGRSRDRFYPRYQEQIPHAVSAGASVEPEFLAQALESADSALPETVAVLAAILYGRDKMLFAEIMPKLLKRFGVHFVRAYAWVARTGRSGSKINLSGHLHRRLFQKWFDEVPVGEIAFLPGGVEFSLLDALRCFRLRISAPEKQALLTHRHNLSFGWTREVTELPDIQAPACSGHYAEYMRTGEIQEWIPPDIPHLERLAIGIDLSFSMRGTVGGRPCIEIAAMIALTLGKRNRLAYMLPFLGEVVDVGFNSGDTIATNSGRICRACRGGSQCMAPLKWLNKNAGPVSSVVILSDDFNNYSGLNDQWTALRAHNPDCHLYCICLAPVAGNKRLEMEDAVYLEGFSDQGFVVLGLGSGIDKINGLL